ncbi:hypothetical protein HN415_01140, partial [Candidatus Woesearchaeota archaeon]|nr:hypothetical protein [Candidatus Woesearchaeota archaeon]
MALSLYNNKDKQKYFLNHYRSKKLDDGYLVTNDYGSWVYLSKEEFKQLKIEKI